MKAWVQVSNDADLSKALALQEVPSPPGLDEATLLKGAEVLVRVTHAALNPADLQIMKLPVWLPFRGRATPGLDLGGEVVRLGPDAASAAAHAVRPLAAGARVCACLSVGLVAAGYGALAEYVAVPADLLTRLPEGLAMEAGVGMLGCAGQTAALIMGEAPDITKGSRVLVNGGSSSVGSLVVQIAKARGAHVVAVCSAANAALVQRLGADETIDYQVHDPLPAHVAATQQPFDLIVDCAGSQALYDQSTPYLAPQGAFLSIVGGPSQGVVPFVRNKLLPRLLGGIARTFRILGLMPSGERGRQVAALFAEGMLREMPVDSVHAMADVVQAYEKLSTKRAKGKIVIRVQD